MRRVAVWLAWFGGLLLLWLVLVGTVQDVERIAGLAAAAIGATAVEVVRSQGLLRYRVEWPWVARGARQLLQVVPDFVRVLAVLPRRPRGASGRSCSRRAASGTSTVDGAPGRP
jgi:hypothetical protein